MHGSVGRVASSIKITYRPDIDGLRAIAVLSVLAYHYRAPFPKFPLIGGFTGVDVFFVISGFLITQILASEIKNGTFSIFGFYDRRIRRIAPALLVMLGTTLFAGKFLLMPGDYKTLAASAASAAFGTSNFYFLLNTGYFDQVADLMPLLHTWSLAVEEQFYLAWPLLLVVLVRGRRSVHSAVMIAGLVVLGFAASLIWFKLGPKSAFYMAVPRAWELDLGALLVFLPRLPRIAGELATGVGLAVIGAGFVTIEAAHFPGLSAAVPCIGAALVIWPRQDEAVTARWLGRLAPVGLISYSLYLWHWPVWVLFRFYINGGQPQMSEAIALGALSVGLAVLSYFCVERPFRKPRWQPFKSISVGLACCVVILCASMYIYKSDGLPARIPPEAFATRDRVVMWKRDCKDTAILPGVPLLPSVPFQCVLGTPWEGAKHRAILWGDSNAEHLAAMMDVEASRANVSVLINRPCPAILNEDLNYDWPDVGPTYNVDCARSRRALLDFIRRDNSIETVILASSWQSFLSLLKPADVTKPSSSDDLMRAATIATLQELEDMGKRVIVIKTIPQWSFDPLPCSIKTSLLRKRCAVYNPALTRDGVRSSLKRSNEVFLRVAPLFPGVRFIDPVDGLCGTGTCITRINDEFIYYDAGHFRRNLNRTTVTDLAKLIGLDDVLEPSP
jgi:peptidoglycan/LPS O-acetylase OafA/YrhL